MKKLLNKKNSKGFTLIELLYVFSFIIFFSFQFKIILENFNRHIFITIIGGILLSIFSGCITVGILDFGAKLWEKKNKFIKFTAILIMPFSFAPFIFCAYYFKGSISFLIFNLILALLIVALWKDIFFRKKITKRTNRK